jgi:hypothetical protein
MDVLRAAHGPVEERRLDLGTAARRARACGGVGYVEQALDILTLRSGPGRLEARDYYALGLYDHRRHDGASRRSFLGRAVLAELADGVVDDLAARLAQESNLRAHGLPTPRTEAILADRPVAGGPPCLADDAALGRYLRERGAAPLLVQPLVEHIGAGTQTIGPWQPATDSLPLGDGRREPVARLCSRLAPYRRVGCLLRTGLQPHTDLAAAHGARLSSIRLLLRREPGGLVPHRAAWRIPAGGSLTDGFREPANLLAAVDPDSGRVWRVVQGLHPGQREVARHPDTGAELLGRTLPDWGSLVAVARAAGELASRGVLLAVDMASSAAGPVVLGLLRHAGDPFLVQLAHGTGLLDGDLRRCLQRAAQRPTGRRAA